VAEEAIDLWSWSLAVDDAAAARLAATLSADELARARRFVFPVHARRFIAARAGLRRILAGYRGCAPADLGFRYAAHGKPALADNGPPLFFNLSHSGHLAVLGVSTVGEIGVDVETVTAAAEDVAARFFSASECAALAALPQAARAGGFFRCWTRKEAMVKALGEGLSMPLDSFDVTLAPEQPARLLRLAGEPDAAERWSLFHFEPAADCIGAVAVPRRQCGLVFRGSISP